MTTTPDRIAVVTPANHVPGPKQGQWTYAHYAALPEDGQHYEIVHGVLSSSQKNEQYRSYPECFLR